MNNKNVPQQDTPESLRKQAIMFLDKWLDDLDSRRGGMPPIDRAPIYKLAFLSEQEVSYEL